MIKLSLKNELRVFFILLFIVPVINIILFNATTSIFSAVIIVVSLLVFFSIAIINLTKIAESLSEFERNSTRNRGIQLWGFTNNVLEFDPYLDRYPPPGLPEKPLLVNWRFK